MSDDEEDEADASEDDATVQSKAQWYAAQTARPRNSVSAEAFGNWNQLRPFAPPVYPKSEDLRQRIQGVLLQSFLFSSLDQPNMDIIIGAMVERPCQAGERIIQEGDDGEVMFVVEQGIFDCAKLINGQEMVVKECRTGDAFGELALLYSCPRMASVVAREESLLWQLDRESFNHIVRDFAMKTREAYKEFIRSVPLLTYLGEFDSIQLADVLRQEDVAAGATVIQQGEEGSRFYLVEYGELIATKWAADGTQQQVLAYKRGDYFGELALINNECRAATVIATTDARLLWVDRKVFQRLLGPVQGIMASTAATMYT